MTPTATACCWSTRTGGPAWSTSRRSSSFRTSRLPKDFDQPAAQVSLERVDLTAYNYGNALAVARIYRKLGQAAKAEEFDALAAKISAAVLEKMWRPEKQFFFSLRAERQGGRRRQGSDRCLSVLFRHGALGQRL